MHEFRRPRWIILSLAIVLFAAASVALGMWQLRRLDERRAENVVISSRLDREPVELSALQGELDRLGADGFGPSDVEYTRVIASGTFVEDGAVQVRSQVHNGQAGTHAIHAFDLGDGTAVLVNVGWYPLGYEAPPLADVFTGTPVQLSGVVRASQLRPSFGRQEPEGLLDNVARVDIARIQEQMPLPLADVWIQMTGPASAELPVLAPLPELDEGPHFSYAIQWFSFATIAVVFYAALARRELKRVLRVSEAPDRQ